MSIYEKPLYVIFKKQNFPKEDVDITINHLSVDDNLFLQKMYYNKKLRMCIIHISNHYQNYINSYKRN